MKHKKEIAHVEGLLANTKVPDAKERWLFESATRQVIELVEANKRRETSLKLEMDEDMGGEEWVLTATATVLMGDVTAKFTETKTRPFGTTIQMLIIAGRDLQQSVHTEAWHASNARKERLENESR